MPRYYVRIPGQSVAAIIETSSPDGVCAAHLTHPDYRGAALFRGMTEPDAVAAVYGALARAFQQPALLVALDGADIGGNLVVESREASDARETHRVFQEAAKELARAAYDYTVKAPGLWLAAVGWCKALMAFRVAEASRADGVRASIEAEGVALATLALGLYPEAANPKLPKK